MTLANWQANGWLSEHEPTVQEINDLFAVLIAISTMRPSRG